MARRRRYTSDWPRYVPVAERRRNAARLAAVHRADGRALHAVEIAGGRAIAKTFWGQAWCQNLERYGDSGRLSRGRTYVRNGSVIDLHIEPGEVSALVSGTSVYTVRVQIEPLVAARWRRLCDDCTGGINSLVELLRGRFADGVMEVLSRPDTGMFPEPGQISVGCSCPDWATMCKHVVAVLLGIGARLDEQPELLFTLRQVDQSELITASAAGIDATTIDGPVDAVLADEDLGALFGIELATELEVEPPAPAPKKPRKNARKKRSPPQLDPRITAVELRDRGVPSSIVQTWLRKGLIEHSGERGVYVRTDASETLVSDYLARESTRRSASRRSR